MFLIAGFKYGFRLFSYESPNLLSARQQSQVVDQKLAKEQEAHRLAGPSDTPPFSCFQSVTPGYCSKENPRGISSDPSSFISVG